MKRLVDANCAGQAVVVSRTEISASSAMKSKFVRHIGRKASISVIWIMTHQVMDICGDVQKIPPMHPNQVCFCREDTSLILLSREPSFRFSTDVERRGQATLDMTWKHEPTRALVCRVAYVMAGRRGVHVAAHSCRYRF